MRARLPGDDRVVFRTSHRSGHLAAAAPGVAERHDPPGPNRDGASSSAGVPAAAHRTHAPEPAPPAGDPALGHEPFRGPESREPPRAGDPRPGDGRETP